MIKIWNSFSILIVLAMLVLLAPAAVLLGPPENAALAQVPGGATLIGHLSFPGNAAGRVMTVRFYDPICGEVGWSPKIATTDADGNFTIPDLAAGTYHIIVKNHTCLSEVERGIVLVDNTTTYVDFGPSLEGDSNDDDRVNIVDISILLAYYGPTGHLYNVNCDFNRNGRVNIVDISILLGSYPLWGCGFPP